jgi:hypothetical protein
VDLANDDALFGQILENAIEAPKHRIILYTQLSILMTIEVLVSLKEYILFFREMRLF